MKEEEYKAWLREGGAQIASSNTRAYAIRTIENKLAELGSSYTTLEEAWNADNFTQLINRLQQMRLDFINGGHDFRIIMPESNQPLNRLVNWRSWLGQYGRFLSGEERGQRDADRIRQYVLEHYIEPAREQEQDTVEILVRDVNAALVLEEAWPNICQALQRKKFLELADLAPPRRIGADMSPATRFYFDLRSASSDQLETQSKVNKDSLMYPTNLILYGPPGTGKTYATAYEAVRLCDGEILSTDNHQDRQNLMERYHELKNEGRISFITFHQSFDYESFVEGMRPETGEDEDAIGFHLEAKPGIFREICALAEQALVNPTKSSAISESEFKDCNFWKMGLGAIGSEHDVYEQAIANDYIALGWGGDVDWSSDNFTSLGEIKTHWESKIRDNNQPGNWNQTHKFRNEMKIGDIVIIPYGNSQFRAVAQIVGNYEFDPSCQGYYPHRRKVRWLLTLDEPLPLDTIVDGKFTMLTLYELPEKRIKLPALTRLLSGDDKSNEENTAEEIPQQFVLIIDEINRANISKVFGELITLIEPDKRLGMPNALTLTLPYSRRDFGVPSNLHIIGTMNTADRSIALLDTALRRRFKFKEMAPNPELLKTIDGINLKAFMLNLNERIEYLVDREHRIGHAFFMSCKNRNDVDAVMRDKIIPLLQEYFFEDWSRIYAVLGDGFISKCKIKAPPGIDGLDLDSWFVLDVFKDDAYNRLVSVQTSSIDNTSYPDEDQNRYESPSE